MNVLIIGGNRSLGLALTEHYLAQGDCVTSTYHDRNASEGLFNIKSENLTIHECDVTNLAHVEALANKVNDIDLVIYNSGTKGYTKRFIKPINNTSAELESAMQVNCFGVDALIRAFYSKISSKPHSVFAYMSTGVSNTQGNASSGYHPYRASKAAGNSIVRNWDIAITEKWIQEDKPVSQRPVLFALTPGLVDVGMGAGVDGAMPVEEAIKYMVEVIKHVRDTKDSHALWSYKKIKIEAYELPNVLKNLNPQNVQSEKPIAPVLKAYPLSRAKSKKSDPTSSNPLNRTHAMKLRSNSSR